MSSISLSLSLSLHRSCRAISWNQSTGVLCPHSLGPGPEGQRKINICKQRLSSPIRLCKLTEAALKKTRRHMKDNQCLEAGLIPAGFWRFLQMHVVFAFTVCENHAWWQSSMELTSHFDFKRMMDPVRTKNHICRWSSLEIASQVQDTTYVGT